MYLYVDIYREREYMYIYIHTHARTHTCIYISYILNAMEHLESDGKNKNSIPHVF